jgi:hypothetical protein
VSRLHMRCSLTLFPACLMAGASLLAVTALAQPTEAPGHTAGGAIGGAVKDPSGAAVPGAAVTLENAATNMRRASVSEGDGRFHFAALEPGTYSVAIVANGFAFWASGSVTLDAGESYEIPLVMLQIASASETVDVTPSRHDIAEEQLKTEEKQRLNGIFPNFKVTYDPNAAPLSAGQKFQLAWATTIDPATILLTGAIAGYEQGRNNIRGYGQGSVGYAKRFGANYADVFTSEMIGTAALPALLHQDPRYFYRGTGNRLSRALSAIANTVICKGDNGHWQPDYSGVIGNVASAGLSNLYYPPSSRGAQLTISNTLLGFGFVAVGNLYQEFVARELTPSAPRTIASNARLILREGTPVSLILTGDLTSEGAEGKSVAFALINDIRVDGVTVAKRGSIALGVAHTEDWRGAGESSDLEVRIEYLQVAEGRVMLRASKEEGGATGVSLRRSRVVDGPATPARGTEIPAGTALTVYVARDASVHAVP